MGACGGSSETLEGAITAAPTTTAAVQRELEALCNFDELIPQISCQAVGVKQGSQLRWESNVSGWNTGISYDVELLQQHQLVPEVVITLQQCEGSDCILTTTKVDTSAIAGVANESATASNEEDALNTHEDTQLAANCFIDNVNHHLSCQAVGSKGGSLTWSSNAPGFGTDYGDTYNRELEWGLVLDQISIDLEECFSSDCHTVTTSLDLSLEPRGDCPESFEGWFETFPLNDLNVISEVEPPARIIGSVLEQPGIFRLPYWQNDVEVRMPIDATLVYGLKYLLTSNLNDANPDGLSDIQYGLRFETACEGLWFTIEHMYELSPEILPYFDGVPTEEAATSHQIGPLNLSRGDLVGTTIGFPRDGNAFVAFGVFDDYERVPTAGSDFINAACYYDFFSLEIANELRSKTVERWPVSERLGTC